uniref:CSC1/OSCA1-like cytosolic domain-containing protein n=1 Tax=Noctiluca scintillans TaxID=2966 RepID=A0A7S1FGR8_NOCSC|mmetsp:Transcript_60077/g.159787  ORF Transcript_60077/g.159787 Transcript_60077/m.159787 type:complete len:956 (+) Transcript_60077:70-2937(+)
MFSLCGASHSTFSLLVCVLIDANGADRCESGGCMRQAPALLQVQSMLMDRAVDTVNQSEVVVFSASPNSTESEVVAVARIKCGQKVHAPDGFCPEACPFWTEEPSETCSFRCVAASDCGSLNSKHNIADETHGYCRSCIVAGCASCSKDGGDVCEACKTGYILENGQCSSWAWGVWISSLPCLVLLSCFACLWYVDLRFLRTFTNPKGFADALSFRSRTKLQWSPSAGEGLEEIRAHAMGVEEYTSDDLESSVSRYWTRGGRLWPVLTNLHSTGVAGPGLALFFNFQIALVVWGVVLVCIWVFFAYSIDPDLFAMGLYDAKTPQQYCTVVAQGHSLQMEFMWAKVLFLAISYLVSFLSALGFAVCQLRCFHRFDEDWTLGHYAAELKGLPPLLGTALVEEDLKKFVAEAVCQDVVGVSVCWNYITCPEEVETMLENELAHLETLHEEERKDVDAIQDVEPCSGYNRWVRRVFLQVDKLFGFYGQASQKGERDEKVVQTLLLNVSSSDTAIVVFETEEARNLAVAKMHGFAYGGNSVSLEKVQGEPSTVCWVNFGVGTPTFIFRCCVGFAVMMFGVALWGAGFYLPYAYYLSLFSYSHDEEPGAMQALAFSMLVVGGNQAMYMLCQEISQRVGFRNKDHAEAFYCVLYITATFLNLCSDLSLEFWIGYQAMVQNGIHTADGRLLGDLTDYQQIFESYPIQRILGQRVFAYAISCFYLPFICEAIFAIFLPAHIMKLLIRSHPEIRGRDAEKSLEFFAPMDLTRYGDIFLNLLIVIVCLFFPTGGFLKLVLCFLLGGVYVYVYDCYRVLRCVPTFEYATLAIDSKIQLLLAFPCSLILAALVFKMNCVAGFPCLHGVFFVSVFVGAIVLHCIVHVLLVIYVVPCFGRQPHVAVTPSWAETSVRNPSSWFSSNPVHCLRSRYVYKHDPPCTFHIPGKEHLLAANTKIGVHYEQTSKTR